MVGKIIKKLINIHVKGDILANIIATVLWRSVFFFFFRSDKSSKLGKVIREKRKINNEK